MKRRKGAAEKRRVFQHMIEIEKPRIDCIENPGDASYGKYVVEPLERGYGTTWATPCGGFCCPHCPAPR